MSTPVKTKDEKASKKQTLVWFHGGAFIFGGIDYYGAEYVMEFDDVILVTVQYRLNAFGFMSTEDKAAPGNYGSLDQVWPLHLSYLCLLFVKKSRTMIWLEGKSMSLRRECIFR